MQIGVEAARAVDNKRVFVVDTDKISRMAAVFMLHDENETHELPSLKAAFDKAAEWKPDLLVLGEALVNEEGRDVFARCAQAIPGVKTLLLAGEGKEEFAQACRQSGADGVVYKPLTVERLRDRVDALLGRKRRPIAIQAA